MYILITYDVSTSNAEGILRLRKVARLCQNYGQRVQNSVFECIINEVQLTELQYKLKQTIDAKNDSIRIYYLNKNENRRIITLGLNRAYNLEEILIF